MDTLNAALPLLIDTHCHFDPVDDAGDLLREATAQRVQVLAIGGGATLNATAKASGTLFTQGYDWAHPEVPERDELDPDILAVGEMGFDFHYEQGSEIAERQRIAFIRQAEFARARGVPIVVHTREADTITVETLRDLALPRTGVIHSYTGNVALARTFLDLGYFISLSGIVTFRNADSLREVAKFLPADRLLVETDTPYLAPVPLRGKRNRPAYIRETAAFIAALRGVTLETFAEQTTRNAATCFALPESFLK